MKRTKFIAGVGIAILAIGAISAFADTALIPSWDGERTSYVPCSFQCYDLQKNPQTNGYDPAFLADPQVKQSCQESHADLSAAGLPDLGYCSKALGTL